MLLTPLPFIHVITDTFLSLGLEAENEIPRTGPSAAPHKGMNIPSAHLPRLCWLTLAVQAGILPRLDHDHHDSADQGNGPFFQEDGGSPNQKCAAVTQTVRQTITVNAEGASGGQNVTQTETVTVTALPPPDSSAIDGEFQG